MLTQAALRAIRADLQARLAEVEKLDRESRDSRRPVELDQTSVGRLSRMDAMQQQAMALATERRRQLERRKLQAAIRRIDDDAYGDCVRCDEEIEPARLALDPTITLCADCIADKDG